MTMKMTRLAASGLMMWLLAAGTAWTQEAETAQPAEQAVLRLFLDCRFCFEDFLREEVAFIEYVRDRTDADVHTLITRSETAGGGTEYTLSFIGRGRFAGRDRTLRTVTIEGDTEDRIRRQLANALTVGVLDYAAEAGRLDDLSVSVDSEIEAQRTGVSGADPWRNWVFTIGGNASVQAEETSREAAVRADIGADRITPDWKISIGMEFDQETERFDVDDRVEVRSLRRDRELRWLIVKGFGEHWSAGAVGQISSSTFENRSLALEVAPAIEFNFFPYSAYTRRQLRVQYAIGSHQARYLEETLFGRLEDTLARQEFSITLDQREPWGTLEARAEFSQFLQDLSLHRLDLDGEVDVRLARGLSVEFEIGGSRVRDQISLPRRGATSEEVLLRLRELQSSFEFEFSVGLSYSFGSIYSSLVNPRFGQ